MNVSNSNKLGLPISQASAGGARPSSAKSAKTSSGDAFVDFLQAKAQPKPEAQAKPDPRVEQKSEREPDAGQKQMGQPDGKQAGKAPDKQAGKAPEKQVEAKAMPTTPGLPGLQGPGINDRVLGAPVASPIGAMVEKTPAAPTEEAGVDSLTRRVVWNDFLRKMKDELGILPEDVLHAFSQLTDEDLNMPPQQTVDKIVMALGLNAQEAQVAKTHFVELVQKTQSPTLGDELSASHKQLNLTLMTQRELQRKALQKSLKSMDENFFMNSAAHLNAQAELRNLMQQQALKDQTPEQKEQGPAFYGAPAALEAGSMESADLGARLMNAGPSIPAAAVPMSEPLAAMPETPSDKMSLGEASAAPVMSKATAGKASAAQAEVSQPAGMNQLLAQMQAPAADDQKAMEALLKKFNDGKLASAQPAMNVGSEAATQAASAVKAAPAAPAAAAGMAAAIGGIFAGTKGDKDAAQEDGEGTDGSSLTQSLGARDQMQSAKGPGGEFKTELAQQAGGPVVANEIKDVMQNAEVLVKDGGGEMKVVLRPDGLGEVTMKVNVENGKVSVQMVTESDEAKKMIEREMGSLKASLHQNNLRLETIKVDTASSMGAQLDQQYQDSQRQQAQQTMEQFRQNQQGWRKSFFEVPSARNYRGQNETPRDVKAPSRAQAKGNKRLDLVA